MAYNLRKVTFRQYLKEVIADADIAGDQLSLVTKLQSYLGGMASRIPVRNVPEITNMEQVFKFLLPGRNADNYVQRLVRSVRYSRMPPPRTDAEKVKRQEEMTKYPGYNAKQLILVLACLNSIAALLGNDDLGKIGMMKKFFADRLVKKLPGFIYPQMTSANVLQQILPIPDLAEIPTKESRKEEPVPEGLRVQELDLKTFADEAMLRELAKASALIEKHLGAVAARVKVKPAEGIPHRGLTSVKDALFEYDYYLGYLHREQFFIMPVFLAKDTTYLLATQNVIAEFMTRESLRKQYANEYKAIMKEWSLKDKNGQPVFYKVSRESLLEYAIETRKKIRKALIDFKKGIIFFWNAFEDVIRQTGDFKTDPELKKLYTTQFVKLVKGVTVALRSLVNDGGLIDNAINAVAHGDWEKLWTNLGTAVPYVSVCNRFLEIASNWAKDAPDKQPGSYFMAYLHLLQQNKLIPSDVPADQWANVLIADPMMRVGDFLKPR